MDRVSTMERMSQLMSYFGIKQIDIVNKTGLPQTAISMYCNGKREPRQDAIAIICKAYSIDPAWMLGYDVPMFSSGKPPAPIFNDNDMEFLLKYKQLRDDQKDMVINLIDTFLKK